MATFVLLSVFPLIPLYFYFGFFQEWTYPVDKVCGTLNLIFLALELFSGILSLKLFISCQTSQFIRLCQEESLQEAMQVEMRNLGRSPIQEDERKPLISN